MFTHFSFPDWHLGVAVMGEYEFYERIVSPIFRDIRNTQGKIIVTFDFDGTLADTNQLVMNSFKHIYKNKSKSLL